MLSVVVSWMSTPCIFNGEGDIEGPFGGLTITVITNFKLTHACGGEEEGAVI